jgi:hypothetical protein
VCTAEENVLLFSVLITALFDYVFAGDHALTALAIGGMLGIAGNGQVFTGPEIDRIDDGALRAIVLSCNVYARASPENKLRIVRALQVRQAARFCCALLLLHAHRQAVILLALFLSRSCTGCTVSKLISGKLACKLTCMLFLHGRLSHVAAGAEEDCGHDR